ncbi:MAG: proteasome subunit beta [Acidobacteria bacterium]|nr:proteasome subunit beta [Acidobacteriota bacterium]
MRSDWARAAFAPDGSPSFADLLRRLDPGLLPSVQSPAPVPAVAIGTTILALTFDGGIVMAGDRRATEGLQIADRRIEKVFPADDYSAVAIAGVAGTAIDMVKLFQVELQHYEKIEGDELSLEGKANRLAQMIKLNFPAALQGLVVVPLFGGFDRARGVGRIFRFDVVGGKYEEADHATTGSGGVHARGTLKKRWRPGLSRAEAIRAAVEALVDAAEEDAATGGPDLIRSIYPIVATVSAEGYRQVPDSELKTIVQKLLAGRA